MVNLKTKIEELEKGRDEISKRNTEINQQLAALNQKGQKKQLRINKN